MTDHSCYGKCTCVPWHSFAVRPDLGSSRISIDVYRVSARVITVRTYRAVQSRHIRRQFESEHSRRRCVEQILVTQSLRTAKTDVSHLVKSLDVNDERISSTDTR